MTSKWIQFGLGGAICVAGFAIAAMMVMLGQSAEKSDIPESSLAVTAIEVTRAARPITLAATGVVQPAQSISVVPQVAGRITKVAEEFVPGGRFQAGEIMLTIDSRDYAAAVQEAEARVQQADLELQIERGRGAVAEREWKLIGGDEQSQAQSDLALRKPHLLTAERTVEAAEAGLERANLALSRTRIRAPFNAVVVSENAALGQVVGAAGSIASLVGTDTLWVTVSLPVSDIRSLNIPGVNGEEASKALISQRLAEGSPIQREGRVLRLIGQLEAQTRNAQLLVAIEGAMEPDDTGSILLPGAYVSVTLYGREIADGFSIPRTALRDNELIWSIEDSRLASKRIKVHGGDQDSIIFTSDFADGTAIITSSIALPVEGMLVKEQE
jgi:RND family efflux transporter MFP subunit